MGYQKTTLDESDYRALEEAMEKLRNVTVGDSSEAILGALKPCVPVTAGMIGRIKIDSAPVVTNVPLLLPGELLESWMGSNPQDLQQAYAPVFESNPGDFWRDRDRLPADLRDHLEVLQGLDRFNLGEGAGYKVYQRDVVEGGVEYLMMALLTERKTRFPGYTAARLKALVPAVEEAYDRMGLPLVATNPLFEQILEEDETGYICLDEQGTVTELNQRAHDLVFQYREAAGVAPSKLFLKDFVKCALKTFTTCRLWKLPHRSGAAVLQMRLHRLRKEKLGLPHDVQLLKMQEWSLPELPWQPAVFKTLTPRQQEIALLLARTGLSYVEIAVKVGIEDGTLRSHVQNIYRKLKVHSRAELVTLLNGGTG